MYRLRAAFLVLALACASFLSSIVMVHAQDEPRTALVVGNGKYGFAPLANPANDATDVAEALQQSGFIVNLLIDATREEILEAASLMAEILQERGGTGLFYFAGHGVQVSGENYLLPIVEAVPDASRLAEEAVSAAEIVDRLSAANNGLNIIILDACRDNPLTGGTSGLSRIDSSASLFVSYSTSPGAVALDGTGRNSPYTKHLTLSLTTPGLNLEETFKRTLKGVYQETGGKQTPWLSSSFFGEFVFKDESSSGAPAPKAPANPGAAQPQTAPKTAQLRMADPQKYTRQNLNGVYQVSGRNPNGSRYAGMATLHDFSGTQAVTWWIGRDVFQGKGELAGRMLVVDWNSTHPVVYTFGENGLLDGEWADGSATDRLKPFGLSQPNAVPANGQYKVSGRNADGSSYSGTVLVDGDGEDYELQWRIGNSSYSGRGKLVNGLLVIDWGSTQPIIYAIREDGSLAGLWDSGRASEIATPR